MARHNFRDVQSRFGHIDARIVQAEVCFRPQEEVATARIVLALYPWWEHPLYVAARKAGTQWGFHYGDDAFQEMTVEAIDPQLCELRPNGSATDLGFLTQHPVLWEFENQGQIFCNSDFDPRELIERLTARKIPNVTTDTLLRYLSPWPRYKAPYSLGYFPFTLYQLVSEELKLMNVKLSLLQEPKPCNSLVALSIDDSVVVVAENFFLEIPEFEHRPDWFRPESEPASR